LAALGAVGDFADASLSLKGRGLGLRVRAGVRAKFEDEVNMPSS